MTQQRVEDCGSASPTGEKCCKGKGHRGEHMRPRVEWQVWGEDDPRCIATALTDDVPWRCVKYREHLSEHLMGAP